MSQAELAYKVESSINEIKKFETNGFIISGSILLKVLDACNATIDDFMTL